MNYSQLKVRVSASAFNNNIEWMLYESGVTDLYHLGVRGSSRLILEGVDAQTILEHIK